jgi:hypothetical protein
MFKTAWPNPLLPLAVVDDFNFTVIINFKHDIYLRFRALAGIARRSSWLLNSLTINIVTVYQVAKYYLLFFQRFRLIISDVNLNLKVGQHKVSLLYYKQITTIWENKNGI